MIFFWGFLSPAPAPPGALMVEADSAATGEAVLAGLACLTDLDLLGPAAPAADGPVDLEEAEEEAAWSTGAVLGSWSRALSNSANTTSLEEA